MLDRNNLDESRYDCIVKLTSDDPYIIKDLSKLVAIQHTNHNTIPPPPATVITLSSLTLGVSSNVKNIVSIFEGDNLPQRREQIILLGEWVDGPLKSLIRDFKYKIVLVRRNPRSSDKQWCDISPHIKCVYSPDRPLFWVYRSSLIITRSYDY